MNFLSVTFLAFFCAVVAGVKLARTRQLQQWLLLGASYVFYACFDLRFLGLLVLLSVLAWASAREMAARKAAGKPAKWLLGLSVGAAVAVLGFFKYWGFFVESFCTAFGLPSQTLKLLLPVGISFYIFQTISYLCDVYSGKTAPAALREVLLFIGFFPTIVSGPIQKSHTFLPQLNKRLEVTKAGLETGACRFLLGAIKKAVIADRLGLCVRTVFAAPAAYSGVSLMSAAMAFTIQIYCDFSGYSDMAVGIGNCLGLDLGRNFDMPYIAQNPSDFWRRWHISLSSWFRDYVYIPLGGSRKGKLRTYVNLFLTMLLSGLWHGANWTFLVWGGLHGLWSAGHRLLGKGQKNRKSTLPGRVLNTLLCFAAVSLLWIVFQADSISTAWVFYSRMLTLAEGIAYFYVFVPLYALPVLGVQIYAAVKNKGSDPFRPLNLDKFSGKLLFCAGVLLVFLMGYFGESAFLYAQF